MTIYTISSVLAFVISFFLSLFVYLRGIKNKVRRAIIFVIFFIGIWCLFPFLAWIGWPEKSLFLARLSYIAAIFTAPAFLNFGLTILGAEIVPKEQKLIKGSLLVSTVIFLPFLFSTAFIRNVKKVNSYFSIVGGPLYILFILYFGIVCLYCFYKLYCGIKESSGSRKNQIRYVFVGFLLAFLGGIIHFSASIGFHEFFSHDILIVACMLILTYSIIRYRLMDINVVITRTGIFIAVYTLVLGLPFVAVLWLKNLLIDMFDLVWWMFPLILMAVLATAGPFIYIYLNRKAEEKLLKEQRRYQSILKQASVGMTRIRNLQKLLNLITHIVTKTVKITYAAIYIYDRNTEEYVLQVSRDKGRVSIPKLTIDNPLIAWLISKRRVLVYEEVKRRMQDNNDKVYKQLEENMRLLYASVVIPSILEDKFMGLIVLGEKMSGQIYTTEDLNVFEVLASQAALAIENAQFYKEAKEMQDQISQAEKMATIGTMADGLSHQINNRFYALSLIAGDSIDTIKTTDTSKCTPEVQQMIEDVSKALDRIQANVIQGGEVVRGMLRYSRRGEEGFESLELDKILDGTLEMVQFKVKLAELDIIRNFNHVPKIHGNMTQLEEVFFNFIDNANDAIIERKQTFKEENFRGRITILANPKTENIIEITVEDNGIGVKNEDAKKVFTPFFTTKISSRKGTGLGLYVIRRIVNEVHKGKIRFESQYKTGTKFIVELPIAKNLQEKG